MKLPISRWVLAGGLALMLVLGLGLAAPTASGQSLPPTPPPPVPTLEPPAPPPASQPGTNSIQIAVDDATPAGGQSVIVAVTVLDENNNPVSGALCTFSIVSQPGADASIAGGPVATGADGTARTTLYAGSAGGIVQVKAACGDATVTLSVTVSPAPPPASLPGAGTGLNPTATADLYALLVALLASAGAAVLAAGALRYNASRAGKGR